MCATPVLLNLYFMLMSAFRGSQGPQGMNAGFCRSIPVFSLMDTEVCYYQTLNPYPPMDNLSTKNRTTN
ncbi:hypothetical protein FOXB_07869 [Fusarium oxysporum f. sp. conglutinans Fo5176]|uniref:Secreted protein n=1 Tax=Fusarium oxysporum (strain Fo5176) TaxID=660025 RepID=F9FN89_FUSOF|nr:hypothetical protein FOXB_07869 [Fusarium oxysporum f. sp. conglutinans Fo5176]